MTPPNAHADEPDRERARSTPPRRIAIATGSSDDRRDERDRAADARASRGVWRRWTPSGVTTTRRSATTAAPHTDDRDRQEQHERGQRAAARSTSGNHVASSSGIIATSGRESGGTARSRDDADDRRRTAPRRRPAASPASAVAPTRRSAASRCSRRAADSRVAVETKTATGTSAPMTASTIIRIAIGGMSGVGGVVSNAGDRRRAELGQGGRVEADDRDELVGRAEPRVADRPDHGPDPVAELVGGHVLHQCRQRRRDDRLARSGQPIDARRRRRIRRSARRPARGRSAGPGTRRHRSGSAGRRRRRCRSPRSG